jgi:hypothetical protein
MELLNIGLEDFAALPPDMGKGMLLSLRQERDVYSTDRPTGL